MSAAHLPASTSVAVPVAAGMGQTMAALLAARLRDHAAVHRIQTQVRPVHAARPRDGECLTLLIDARPGTDRPAMLADAARRLRATCAAWLPAEDDLPAQRAPAPPPGLKAVPIETLALSLRCASALRRAGIETLGALARLDERRLLAVPHLGRRQVAEVVDALAARGLRPGNELPD